MRYLSNILVGPEPILRLEIIPGTIHYFTFVEGFKISNHPFIVWASNPLLPAYIFPIISRFDFCVYY